MPLIINFSIFFNSYNKVANVLEDRIFTLKYQYMQKNTFIHFQIVVLHTNLFLISSSNNFIPFKEYFFRKIAVFSN